MSELRSNLKAKGYLGDVSVDLAQRIVHAYDNSIYHKMPAAICYPKCTNDLTILVQYASANKIPITVQGGSTATVGQSLGAGLLVDMQRYMHNIITINLEAGWIEVEAGCSLKQMQEHLANSGYEFKVEISPNDRCAIAGMVATNAVGIGGACGGRMSANVNSLQLVMSDGSVFDTSEANHEWHQKIVAAIEPELKPLIISRKQALLRNIGGYDLAEYFHSGNLAAIFSGSEGTLGIIAKVRCAISTKAFKPLIVLYHPDIAEALAYATSISGALAIEMLDANLCVAIRNLSASILPDASSNEVVLLVEHANPNVFTNLPAPWNVQIFNEQDEIEKIWAIRRSAVAIVSKYEQDGRRPLAMIEDTAVPPSKLVEYITSLRQYLDSLGLFYAMYGHVDAGCIHVRPALNLQHDKGLIEQIFQHVKKLCEGFGGVLWGEHGIGYRSEFVQGYWGKEIYNSMQIIKQICDPNELFNPGKIISKKPLRFVDDWLSKPEANSPWLACNGQAACLGDNTKVMCPSYRASGNKAWSPKGRALLMRHWQLNTKHDQQFLASIKESMEMCLGCHACVPECPVAVDIPQAKAEFLNQYYQNNARDWLGYILSKSERHLAVWAKIKHFCLDRSKQADLKIMPDIWTYSFEYKIWQDLADLLNALGLRFEVVKPVALGQSPYNEGDLTEFYELQKQVSPGELIGLEPSVIKFANHVLKYNWQDLAQHLTLNHLNIQLEGEVELFLHCTEQASPDKSDWATVLRSYGLKVNVNTLGCCGMAGAFGLKPNNQEISERLFQRWRLQLNKAETILATGFSCRMQARKFGYQVMHPLQYLSEKVRSKI